MDSHLSAHTLSTLKCKDLGGLCLPLLSLHSTLEGWRRRTALQARYSPLCGTAVRAGLGSASWAAWAGRNRRGENRGGECEGEMPPRGAICLQVCNSRSLSVSCQRITLCGQPTSLGKGSKKNCEKVWSFAKSPSDPSLWVRSFFGKKNWNFSFGFSFPF